MCISIHVFGGGSWERLLAYTCHGFCRLFLKHDERLLEKLMSLRSLQGGGHDGMTTPSMS